MDENNFVYLAFGTCSSLKSLDLTCKSCKFHSHIESEDGKPIGFVIVGDLIKWDEHFLWIRPWTVPSFNIPSPSLDDMLKASDEGELIIAHDFDPKVLSFFYKMGDDEELLVIGSKVVRCKS